MLFGTLACQRNVSKPLGAISIKSIVSMQGGLAALNNPHFCASFATIVPFVTVTETSTGGG
jgi:hypothetical protein